MTRRREEDVIAIRSDVGRLRIVLGDVGAVCERDLATRRDEIQVGWERSLERVKARSQNLLGTSGDK